jgi:RNase H-fold protein (predicted Holliday junction resolvase)
MDERLTSWEAGQISIATRKSARQSNDDIAAAIILREYLERQRGENIAGVATSEEGQP